MLETKICILTGALPPTVLTLDICNVGGSARFGDYAVALRQREAPPVVASAEIQGYPRWSESVLGLVARALHLVAQGAASSTRASAIWAEVFLLPHGVGVPRELAFVAAADKGTTLDVVVADDQGLCCTRTLSHQAGNLPALQLLVRLIAHCLWAQDTVPALPAVLVDRS